ncbi:MAG: tetratricopeptide repeat protein, partial [Candidatus Latescibacterota bacterium]
MGGQSLLDRFDRTLLSNRRWLFALFGVSFLLKIIYVIQSSGALHVQVPIMDTKFYDRMAQEIAGGKLIGDDAFFMGPLYSYVLAAIYTVFGRDFMIVRLIQVAGGALVVVLTYLIGERVFRPSIAFVAAVILILYGAITFYEGQMLMMWLGTLINLVMLYVLISAKDESSCTRFAVAGLLLGLSALARANILIFLPVVVIWLLFVSTQERRGLKSTVFAVAAFAAILPATLHNYVAGKDFVLITSNGGVNFFIGNGEEAKGYFFPPRGITLETDHSVRNYVERLYGRDMKASEVSRYWFGQTWEFFQKNPARVLALFFKKTAMFFSGYEVPQIESFDITKAKHGTLRLLFVNFWALVSLGLLGMIWLAKDWRRFSLFYGFILSFALSIILFFITARYRIQMTPMLSLFAAYALVVVLPGAVKNIGRNILPLLLLLILVIATRPGIFALPEEDVRWREHIHEAGRMSEVGDFENAIEEVNKAVEIHPDVADSYVYRAFILKNAGKRFEAIENYSKALKISPDLPRVRYDLAQTLRSVRMYEPAIEEYLRAIEIDPVKPEAYNNLGITYVEMKRFEDAVPCFRKVIEIDPRYIKAYNNLGSALAQMGDAAEARKTLERAIEIDPGYKNSYK